MWVKWAKMIKKCQKCTNMTDFEGVRTWGFQGVFVKNKTCPWITVFKEHKHYKSITF